MTCKSYYFLWLSICSSLKWDNMADTPNLPSFSTLPFVTLFCVLGDWIQGLHQQTLWLMILIGVTQWGAGGKQREAGYFLPRQPPSSTAVPPLFLDVGYPAVTSPWFSVASHCRIHYSLLLVSTITAHGSVNSPFIKFSTNYPVWLCNLFLFIQTTIIFALC